MRLPPDYWSYACRWVAYVHTHRVTEIPINKTLPHFGDVVVMHHAFKKPPLFENRGTTGVCLGHDSRIAGGVLVVSVVNGELKEVCSAKVRTLGEKVGQAWRLHVHSQDSSKAAYVNRKGEVKWSLHEIEVPTVEQCEKEDALEVQDIRELGLGWAWFMDDLRAFLPAWQETELASPSSEEPVTQIEADVPIEPLALQADVTHLDSDLQVYERPLAVTPFGTPEVVPDWQDAHAMHAFIGDHCLGKWIRTDLGVRTFQGLGKNGPAREQVVRRITRDLHTRQVLEDLLCDSHLQVPLRRKCLPACGPTTCHTRDTQTTFVYRLFPRFTGPDVLPLDVRPSRFPSRGGSASFSKLEDTSVRSTLGTRTLSVMQQFIEKAEKDGEEESGTGVSELNVKEIHKVKDTRFDRKCDVSGQEGPRTLNKDAIKALRKLFEDFEDQLQCQNEESDDSTSDEGQEGEPPQEMAVNSIAFSPNDEESDESLPSKEPQLYLCDDWIQPMAGMSRPRELTAREKVKANVAKNCLIVTLMSLELGYGSILERYQQESKSILERYSQGRSESSPVLNSVLLTHEELLARRSVHLEVDNQSQAAIAAMPRPTRLCILSSELAVHSVGIEGVKNTNLKMYHVISPTLNRPSHVGSHRQCHSQRWIASSLRGHKLIWVHFLEVATDDNAGFLPSRSTMDIRFCHKNESRW